MKSVRFHCPPIPGKFKKLPRAEHASDRLVCPSLLDAADLRWLSELEPDAESLAEQLQAGRAPDWQVGRLGPVWMGVHLLSRHVARIWWRHDDQAVLHKQQADPLAAMAWLETQLEQRGLSQWHFLMAMGDARADAVAASGYRRSRVLSLLVPPQLAIDLGAAGTPHRLDGADCNAIYHTRELDVANWEALFEATTVASADNTVGRLGPAEQWENLVASASSPLLLVHRSLDDAAEDGGMLLLAETTPLEGKSSKCMEISYLGVVAEQRRRGIGGCLLDEALRRASAAGATSLRVWVDAENQAARALYASRWFEAQLELACWRRG
ncbi:MAG: GNAT family N-acetyltransferase [Planctomycetales bacterium]|nr:GNAT family N-acetyltransferase [Planctomycetales bacterium]